MHPTNPMMRPSTINMSAKGTRTFNYNVEGLAHCGLVPDMFQDLRNTGPCSRTDRNIILGAEDFIRMWEKCERLKTSIRRRSIPKT